MRCLREFVWEPRAKLDGVFLREHRYQSWLVVAVQLPLHHRQRKSSGGRCVENDFTIMGSVRGVHRLAAKEKFDITVSVRQWEDGDGVRVLCRALNWTKLSCDLCGPNSEDVDRGVEDVAIHVLSGGRRGVAWSCGLAGRKHARCNTRAEDNSISWKLSPFSLFSVNGPSKGNSMPIRGDALDMPMSWCMCEPVETAQSHGGDTHAVVAQLKVT